LDAALFELEVGPRPTEQRQGYRTLLPVDLVIEGELRGTRAAIDLKLTTPTETGGVALAVGQIAVTALAVPHVRSVVFSVNGRRTKVEVPGRQRGVGVVRERDYRGVLK
jgi:spore germination protein GerM